MKILPLIRSILHTVHPWKGDEPDCQCQEKDGRKISPPPREFHRRAFRPMSLLKCIPSKEMSETAL